MLKTIKRLFIRPTVRELLEEELYQSKVSALEAARQSEYWASMQETLLKRIARLNETRGSLQDVD